LNECVLEQKGEIFCLPVAALGN